MFTHRGLSGPAILQVSSFWRRGEAVVLNLLPDAAAGWLAGAKRHTPRTNLPTALREHLPQRLAEALAARLEADGLPMRELGNWPDKALATAELRLASWAFTPTGSEGFAKAEVTAGGVATDELSQQTMEARRVPGLYCIGEAVDVTGWLGGYNFQWAWASAVAAGDALRRAN